MLSAPVRRLVRERECKAKHREPREQSIQQYVSLPR